MPAAKTDAVTKTMGLGSSKLCSALIACLLLSAAPASADLLIQRADKAPSIEPGTTVPDDHTFDLPEGATINLLQTPSGQTFTMRGPFKGDLATFNKNCNGWLAFTRAYCKSADGDQLPVGGTRGVPNDVSSDGGSFNQ